MQTFALSINIPSKQGEKKMLQKTPDIPIKNS